jgi:hypothetical protein
MVSHHPIRWLILLRARQLRRAVERRGKRLWQLPPEHHEGTKTSVVGKMMERTLNPLGAYTTDWKRIPDRCPHCGAAKMQYRTWESDCGGNVDGHYRCTGCDRERWVDGPDAGWEPFSTSCFKVTSGMVNRRLGHREQGRHGAKCRVSLKARIWRRRPSGWRIYALKCDKIAPKMG